MRPELERVEDRLLMATFVVNTIDDTPTNFTEQSLRNAIVALNNSTDATNSIQFSIAANGQLQTINLRQALPTVTVPITIDGDSEPGAVVGGAPLIALNGSNVTTGGGGLNLIGGNSTVRGLAINSFANGSAITISSLGGDTISAITSASRHPA